MQQSDILLVDDEAYVRDSLVELLTSEGLSVCGAPSAEDALCLIDRESFAVIVTDLDLPGLDGLGLLEKLADRRPGTPVILLTGVGTIEDAVKAMKHGAYDFVEKPVDPERFVALVKRALEHRQLRTELAYLRTQVRDLRGGGEIVGSSAAMRRVRELIAQVAPSDATVLVSGESGTGKELVAARIHELSRRSERNLVRVNCAAIPESLFESEFFGHRRGSFTGAVQDRVGRIAEAEGGTLILDEIGVLKPDMQAKLLRVLENGEYQVIGETRTRRADVRVIASTNEALRARVREGAFRADLFYRLDVFPIEIPPLRERRDDIADLAQHFLGRLLRPVSSPSSPERPELANRGPQLDRESIELLVCHDWPGNVRELRNVLERAVILSGGKLPEPDLFRDILAVGMTFPERTAGPSDDLHLRRRVEELERRLIVEALARSEGRKSEAAALLGIDPRNLAYHLRKHGLADPGSGSGEGAP